MYSVAKVEPERGTEDPLKDDFRTAMRHLASGVSVVTTGTGIFRTGLTATSVSSLSMAPPSLIVSINRGSSAFAALRKNRYFGVSFLPATHSKVANRFAGRDGERGIERFSNLDCFELVTGAPLLGGALAVVDCTIEKLVEWHTHALVIGRVEAARSLEGDQPLVYWRGAYIGA